MSKKSDVGDTLYVPVSGEIMMPRDKVVARGGQFILTEAYCPLGHSLISDVEIGGHKGIRFIYTDRDGERETDVVISPVIHKCDKKVLKGQAFKKGETVTVLCPDCKTELPILSTCECGAPVYLFFIDKQLHHNYGHSFCSRIGCVKSSRLRFSQEVLRGILNEHGF